MPTQAIDITENYALSPAVAVRFVDTDHDFDLPPSGWDAVAQQVIKFLDSVQRQLPAKGARFDEAYYLRTHRCGRGDCRRGVRLR